MAELNRQVLIRGIMYPWAEKAPFVVSQKSVKGALEVKPETGELKCHECGEWFESLGAHLRWHGIKAAEYKNKHGLRSATKLVSRQIQDRMAKWNRQHPNAKFGNHSRKSMARPKRKAPAEFSYEFRNEKGSCAAQALEKLQRMASQLGRWPKDKEIRASMGVKLVDLQKLFGCKDVRSLWQKVGLTVKPTIRQAAAVGILSTEFLIEELRDFKPRYGRYPTKEDLGTRLPNNKTFERHFGSFKSAMFDAGLASAVSA
jgi:predicted transcriptional regulator